MDAEEDYDDESELVRRQSEIQKLFKAMEARAKSSLNYLVLEGFITPTEIPGVYEYTPEGLVLVQNQYKKLKDEGLL